MIRASLAAVLLAAAGAAEAAPASVRIGDIVVDYDDGAWQVAAGPDGAAFIPVECDAPHCTFATRVHVAIGPAAGALPALSDGGGGFVTSLWALLDDTPRVMDDAVRDINGLAVFATDRWSGCRAMSPSELTAVLDHAGRRYTFTSGIALGCAGVWGVPREDFADLLAGLRPAP